MGTSAGGDEETFVGDLEAILKGFENSSWEAVSLHAELDVVTVIKRPTGSNTAVRISCGAAIQA